MIQKQKKKKKTKKKNSNGMLEDVTERDAVQSRRVTALRSGARRAQR